MYKEREGFKITQQILINALNRLGDLLKDNNLSYKFVCCGGVVSVLYLKSRGMTQDVDVVFPQNMDNTVLLNSLIKQVGDEFNIIHNSDSLWFNNDVEFIGLDTCSKTIIFNHTNLLLVAAEWTEMLAHKISAYRGDRDIIDAISFLREIKNKDSESVYEKVHKLKPFVPAIPDEIFKKRFNEIWKRTYE